MRRRYELAESSNIEDKNDERFKRKISIHQVPFYVGLIILVLIGVQFGIVWYFEHKLPTPLMVKNEVCKTVIKHVCFKYIISERSS